MHKGHRKNFLSVFLSVCLFLIALSKISYANSDFRSKLQRNWSGTCYLRHPNPHDVTGLKEAKPLDFSSRARAERELIENNDRGWLNISDEEILKMLWMESRSRNQSLSLPFFEELRPHLFQTKAWAPWTGGRFWADVHRDIWEERSGEKHYIPRRNIRPPYSVEQYAAPRSLHEITVKTAPCTSHAPLQACLHLLDQKGRALVQVRMDSQNKAELIAVTGMEKQGELASIILHSEEVFLDQEALVTLNNSSAEDLLNENRADLLGTVSLRDASGRLKVKASLIERTRLDANDPLVYLQYYPLSKQMTWRRHLPSKAYCGTRGCDVSTTLWSQNVSLSDKSLLDRIESDPAVLNAPASQIRLEEYVSHQHAHESILTLSRLDLFSQSYLGAARAFDGNFLCYLK